jgi:uncharacterized protein (DUF4213/DUF364 family)
MRHSDILVEGWRLLEREYQRLAIPVGTVEMFGLNPGWNAVIGSDGSCGVAMSFERNNPLYDDDQTRVDPEQLRSFIGASLFEVASWGMSDERVSRRSVALAALNALSQPFLVPEVLEKKGYSLGPGAADLVRKDDVVVIVGYGGLVREYAGRCRDLHVTDQRPVESFRTTVVGKSISHGPAGITVHPAAENREVLAEADVAVITGSTLVNGTFEEVAGYAKDARVRALYGSSAQLIPDVLFENGINLVMSVAVTDPAQFTRDVINAPDLETAVRKHQRKYNVGCTPDGLEK